MKNKALNHSQYTRANHYGAATWYKNILAALSPTLPG